MLIIFALPVALLFGVKSYNFFSEKHYGLGSLCAFLSICWILIFAQNVQIIIGLRELGS
jgi:hypothetical protein